MKSLFAIDGVFTFVKKLPACLGRSLDIGPKSMGRVALRLQPKHISIWLIVK
jgi:hypothetical protein